MRNLNREYILNRISDIEGLQKEIAELEEIIADELKQKALIIKQLGEIKKKYGKPRLTRILHEGEISVFKEEEHIENYKVRLVISKEGYFKKITYQSLRGNDELSFKDDDELLMSIDSDNTVELLLFTNQANMYRFKVNDIECVKASALGTFIPALLKMDVGEKPVYMMVFEGYPDKKHMVYLFENGKGVRVPISCYETKAPRKKLVNAFSSASPIVCAFAEQDSPEIMLLGTDDKAIIIKSSIIPVKPTRTASGVSIITLKSGQKLKKVILNPDETPYAAIKGINKIKIPAAGVSVLPK